MDTACSKYGGEERCIQGFFLGGGGDLRVGDHLDDADSYRKIILKWIFEKWDGGHELDRSGSNKLSGSVQCGVFLG